MEHTGGGAEPMAPLLGVGSSGMALAMLPIAAVQQSIYEALTPALAPVPVFDEAGPNAAYPYVTIGEVIGGESDTLDKEAVDLELTIHTWSRQAGMLEISTIMATVKDTLHRKSLPASGFQWVTTIWIYAQTLRDPDGKTRHGVSRFRVMTFEQ
jgi:hypothetical protein